jgi:hypothetical protein
MNQSILTLLTLLVFGLAQQAKANLFIQQVTNEQQLLAQTSHTFFDR